MVRLKESPLSSMKTLLRLICLSAIFTLSLRAAEAPSTAAVVARSAIVAAVTAADDERGAASIAADRTRLEAIFSDDLRYAHSSGKIDTKKSYIDAIVAGSSFYGGFDYKERNFLPVAPGIVLMSGRVFVQSRSNDQPTVLDLNFLAVWREENGKWRFLAWQSCRNPPATPPPPAPK
jgi:hypothetical protein